MYKNSKLYSIISYITWIGWIIAFVARDKNDPLVRRHVNQALILNLASTVVSLLARIGGAMGIICFVLDLALLVLYIMGIIKAAKMSEEPLPLVGGLEIIH